MSARILPGEPISTPSAAANAPLMPAALSAEIAPLTPAALSNVANGDPAGDAPNATLAFSTPVAL